MNTNEQKKFNSWLWPDRPIGKAESKQLREEHNALLNSHAELLEALTECSRLLDVAFDFDGDVFRKEHNNAVDAIYAAHAAIAKATGEVKQ
jgi:hypothetical protein